MKHAKKMVLVEYPVPRISTRFNNAYSSADDFFVRPTSNVLYNLDGDMRRTLRRTDLTDREKWRRYNMALQRYLQFVNQKRNDAVLNSKKRDEINSKNKLRSAKYDGEDNDDDEEKSIDWDFYYTPRNITPESMVSASAKNRPTTPVYKPDERALFDLSMHVPLPETDTEDDEIARELNERKLSDFKLTSARPKAHSRKSLRRSLPDDDDVNRSLIRDRNISVRRRHKISPKAKKWETVSLD